MKNILLGLGIFLSINGWSQEQESLAMLENEVKEAVNCSFVVINDSVSEQEAKFVLNSILQIRNTFDFKIPYLRRLDILNINSGETEINSGHFVGIELPNTRDLRFLSYVLRHEIGHVIDYTYDARGSKEWNSVKPPCQIISNYACTNDQELFAEAIAYKTDPEYGKSLLILPANLEKFLNKYLYDMKELEP